MYIQEHPNWPHFEWDAARIAQLLAQVRFRQGLLVGRMKALGFSLQQEAVLKTLTQDVLKTNEIEGERLNAEQIRSSVARRLGIDIGALKPSDRHVDGVVEMALDATGRYDQPLTAERLYGWHTFLFPAGRSGLSTIQVAQWRNDRTGPMEVVSGPIGREKVHFQAPAATVLDVEMKAFIDWFNSDSATDPLLKSAVAHLWFVTVHPFDDGNGRIARAIADMALARSEQSSQRFYSMSDQIRKKRASYYDILEKTQKGDLDITAWIEWFLECLGNAIDGAADALSSVIGKARFWNRMANLSLNDRQRLVLNRVIDGMEGDLTNAKYAKLAKCSSDTALRDLQQLVEQGILARNEKGGRSVSYRLLPLAGDPNEVETYLPSSK